jgi:hypothetical protein
VIAVREVKAPLELVREITRGCAMQDGGVGVPRTVLPSGGFTQRPLSWSSAVIGNQGGRRELEVCSYGRGAMYQDLTWHLERAQGTTRVKVDG